MKALVRGVLRAYAARYTWLALVVGAGCEAPGLGGAPPRDVRWASPHFEYYTRAGESSACPEALDVLEQNFAVLESYLDFSWPTRKKVTYNKYLDKQDYQAHAPCPEDSGGCAHDSTVESPRPFDEHELVHAYLAPSGNPPALFKEGVATALACHPSFSTSTTIPWREALAVEHPTEELGVYTTGSVMVHYLLRHFGGEAFMQLYSSLANRAAPEIVDAAMREQLGMSADEVWQLAQAEPLGCLPIWPCSRGPLPLDGSTVVVAPQCGIVYDARTVDLPVESNLAFVTPRALVWTSCRDGRRENANPRLDGKVPLLTLLPLPAGRYYVEYPAIDGTQIAVRALSEPSVGVECQALAPYPIGADDHAEIAVRAPPAAGPWMVRLRFAGRRQLHLQPVDNAVGYTARLTICADCEQAPASCQTTDVTADGLDVSWDGDYVVHVAAADGSSRVAFELRILER